MPDQPTLFNVPRPEAAAHARSGRGRTRETYARTVVADVTVHDEAALRAAALRVLDGGLTVVLSSPHVEEDTEDDLPDPRDEVTTSAAAALEWCIEPTTGLWPLLEAGAARIVKVDLHVDEQTATRHRVQWTVAIKLDDAPAARELALAACPATEVEARAEIERSFAAVWRWAASPYAPLTEVPGITWTPVDVAVEQIMARSR
ncbi:MAG: hypothetical protein ACRDRZ_00195 [Pseudonocardiaceae bacterium]